MGCELALKNRQVGRIGMTGWKGENRVSRNSRDSGWYKCDSFLTVPKDLLWQEWNITGMNWMALNNSEECGFCPIDTKVQLGILKMEFGQWEKKLFKKIYELTK